MKEQQNGGSGYDWNNQVIEDYRKKTNTCGGYGYGLCNTALLKYNDFVKGKNGAVIGSQTPWAEAALVNAEAKEIITIEYMPIQVSYPGLSAIHPADVAKKFLAQEWKPVDFIFTYSSLEHDGLGRYGDPLSPTADLESVGRARCLLKEGGYLFLGVPMGADHIVYNAHRVYGPYRLSLMTLGFEIIDFISEKCTMDLVIRSECQPILLLKKKSF